MGLGLRFPLGFVGSAVIGQGRTVIEIDSP